jgi:hypothetical protein
MRVFGQHDGSIEGAEKSQTMRLVLLPAFSVRQKIPVLYTDISCLAEISASAGGK